MDFSCFRNFVIELAEYVFLHYFQDRGFTATPYSCKYFDKRDIPAGLKYIQIVRADDHWNTS